MFKRIVSCALLFGSMAFVPPAHAAFCGKRDKVVERLQSKFSEQLAAGGLQASQPVETMVEVWASPETGTFTVLMTNPNGMTCVLAAGTDFFAQPVVAAQASERG